MTTATAPPDFSTAPAPESIPAIAEAPPSSRASWSGLLRLSLVGIPVKAYPANVTSNESHFHQLHAGCGQRIRHIKQCPSHGPLGAGAIVKGYEYAPDQHLILDEEQLDQLRPAKERALTVEHFLDPHQLDHALLSGRHLYLVPDGTAARMPYAVLVDAMRERRKWAVGRVTLGGKRTPALLRSAGPQLILHVLLYPQQCRSSPAVSTDGMAMTPQCAERDLAGQLIDAHTTPINWSDYRDDSAEHLTALVQSTLAGHAPAEQIVEEATVLRLFDALQQSVALATKTPVTIDEPATASTPRARKRRTRRSA